MNASLRPFTLLALAAFLPACAAFDAANWRRVYEQTCALDEQWVVRDTLYFGLSMVAENGTVLSIEDADWHRFESDVLSQAFANGYTVLEARGAWRGADGTLQTEPSRVVIVLHPDDTAWEAAIANVIRRYREQFRQESVLREHAGVCMAP
jgi:hypothetical protein